MDKSERAIKHKTGLSFPVYKMGEDDLPHTFAVELSRYNSSY